MISTSPNATEIIPRQSSGAGRKPRPAPAASSTRIYNAAFWLTYISNLLVTTANATMFRYGDFVTFGGGTELTLGLIVGVGMIGSLLMRAGQGIGIDRYGVRKIWLWSSVFYVLSCLGHLFITDVDGPLVFVLRIVYQTSVAGVFGASITYISRKSPVYKMAEVVGTLGTSGFLGMILGSLLVDRVYGHAPVTSEEVRNMFLVAAAMGAASGLLAWAATRRDAVPAPRRQMPVLWLLRRYQPGPILIMGVTMGFGIGLATTFLRPFAASLNIAGIGTFFSVYAVTAFITRMSIRRLPERIGIRNMVLVGVAFLSLNMLSYLLVRSEWQFVFPAVIIGIAHAILFPAVVAGGSSSFPDRYRGLGTTLMLGAFDLGMFIGSPTAGTVLRSAELLGLPKYPTMFVVLAVLFAALGLWYAIASRGEKEMIRAQRVDASNPTEQLARPDSALLRGR